MSRKADEKVPPNDFISPEMEANLKRVEELSSRLAQIMSAKREVPAALQGPGRDLYMKAATAFVADMMQNPSRMIEHQVNYWGKTLRNYAETQQAMATGKPAPDHTEDARFASEHWQNPMFHYLKEQYLLNAEAINASISALSGFDAREHQRISYFTKQIVDLFSPSNFLATNPDALAKAVETEGQSLVAGLENLVADLEANDGELLVTLADRDAFEVGGNIATTPGKVVFRNELIELIQYAPSTDKVASTPIVLFPPWINKFYILDLKEKSSLIKWVVDQGYTLFVVSWRNADASLADFGLADYVEKGYLEAIRAAKEICNVKAINAIGYCIAGTMLSITLALLKKQKDTSVKSATFFTTMTDFSDRGEFNVFLEDDFVDGIESEAMKNGFLDKFYMSRTFSFLRSNDLIYRPAIKSYMMGEAPPAFDLLFWNGDGTNLPAKMTVEYLRNLCQKDSLARDGFEIHGETVHLDEVTVPLCAVACENDHIAAWIASYNGIRQMGSKDKTFILSESGHVAGIVNPPSKNKYGHYLNGEWPDTAEAWFNGAEKHNGSWWPTWEAWIAPKSGRKVKAREPGSKNFPPLADAPGTYVK